MAHVKEIKESERKKRKRLSRRVKGKTKQEFGDFFEFFRSQGVVGLAIGFVIGAEVKNLVTAFTASYVDPFVGLILPGSGEVAGRTYSVTIGTKTAIFATGKFWFALIDFLIIVLIIYLTYRWLRLDKLDKEKK